MKLKNLLITLGLTLTVGAGVAVGLKANTNFEQVKAYDSRLHIVGNGTFGSWDTTGAVQLQDDGDSNIGKKTGLSVSANSEFKIAYIDGGSIQWGWDSYGSGAMDSKTYTFAEASGANVKIKYDGIYNFFLTDSYKVYMSRDLTISFDANNGTVSPTSKTVTQEYSGGTNTYGDLPTPTRDGYDFDGWYTASTGGTEVTSSSSTYSLTADQTLYAHWTEKTVYPTGIFLASSDESWAIDTDITWTSTGTANEYTLTRDFVANEEFQAVGRTDMYESSYTWYNATDVSSNHSVAYPAYKSGNNVKITNAGNYTVKVNVSTGVYQVFANDFIIPTTVVYYQGGTTGEEGDYSDASQESTITATLDAETNFGISVTNSFGSFFFGYETVDESCEAVTNDLISQGAEKESGVHYIHVKEDKTFSIYVKDDGSIWMKEADDNTQAYAWAKYFLNHVGCNASGTSSPSGWDNVASKYGNLPSTCKTTYFVEGEADEHSDDAIKQALARYDYAVTHHTSLTRFIVGREVAQSNRVNIIGTVQSQGAVMVIVIIGILSITGVGAYYFFRKSRKTEE